MPVIKWALHIRALLICLSVHFSLRISAIHFFQSSAFFFAIEFDRISESSVSIFYYSTAAIWHVFILNVKMKFAENWNWLTSCFCENFNLNVYLSACHLLAHACNDHKIKANETCLLLQVKSLLTQFKAARSAILQVLIFSFRRKLKCKSSKS